MTDPTPPTVLVLPASHVDHGLTSDQLAWLLARASDALPDAGLLKLTLELPEELGTVECGLHGPVMGDGPIGDAECVYQPRMDRGYPSRILRGVFPVPTRKVSIIAGPHGDEPWVLYTAFGGPIAPREPGDPSIANDAEALAESEAFWAVHALSAPVLS